MKKTISQLLFILAATLVLSVPVFAVDATIDTGSKANGLVKITLKDYAGKTVMVQVSKGTEKYQYTLIGASTNIPLQMGTGDYEIAVLENINGKGKAIVQEKFSVDSIDEKAMYKASNPQVDYTASTTAIPAYKKATEGKTAESDKVATVYEDIVKSYKYDDDLAAKISAGTVKSYVPVIDSVYAAKKGICYDYSSLFGGALRSQNIPTRLVMGYVPELGNGTVLHAWNEIWLDGKWVSVDTTFDASAAEAGKSYTMVRDRSKAVVVKVY